MPGSYAAKIAISQTAPPPPRGRGAVPPAGIVFGLLTAATGGFDFFKGWLIAHVLVAALLLWNASPPIEALLKLTGAAAEAEAGQPPLDQVARDISTVRPGRLITVNVVLFAAIIANTVLKPF